jgi:hypothetical protein
MDTLFKGKNPSDNEVKQAKQIYRSNYLKNYQKAYKEQRVQITFRISEKKYQEFEKQAKEKGIKVTTLVREKALQTDKNDNLKTRILLSELLDSMEESIYENKRLNITELLKQLEIIEQTL